MPWDYWDLTYGEIVEVVECVVENETREFKQQATLVHTQGQLNMVAIGMALGGEGTYPELSEVFPSLFGGNTVEAKEEDWQRMLRGFSMLADAHNARR